MGEEGDNRGWDGWIASMTEWRWVWVNSGSWWWTGRPVMLQSMQLQRDRRDWVTELNWTDYFEIKVLRKSQCKDTVSLHWTKAGDKASRGRYLPVLRGRMHLYHQIQRISSWETHINQYKHVKFPGLFRKTSHLCGTFSLELWIILPMRS